LFSACLQKIRSKFRGVVKNSPSAEYGKLEKKNQTLSDVSKILHNLSAHCSQLACKKSGPNSKCSVVPNSPSAEFGKIEKIK
jgi:hypothetical protein